MFKNITLPQVSFTRVLLYLVLGISIFVFCFSTFTVEACADSGNRTPSFQTEAVSYLSHNHTGDSVNGGGCYTNSVFHIHEGDSVSGGGCYQTPIYHTHNSDCYEEAECIKSVDRWTINHYMNVDCEVHGEGQTGVLYNVYLVHSENCGEEPEWAEMGGNCIRCGNIHTITHTYNKLICEKEEGVTIDGYLTNCGKDEGQTIDSYALSCGLEEKVYGSITLQNTTPAWTSGNVTLVGSLDDPEGVLSASGKGVLSFSTTNGVIDSTSQGSIIVSSNGLYTMSVSIDESNFQLADSEVALYVGNIDRTPASISSITYNNTAAWVKSNTITVNASDLQPDLTPGSGLDDYAYSFDGGVTWQSSPSYVCTSNQTVQIQVRDYCGNITPTTTIEINNIDDNAPSGFGTPDLDEWYEGDGPRVFTIDASDLESGLADESYSYDGGLTWTSDNTISKDTDGDFTVIVKDKLGNTTTIVITNQYSVKEPEIIPEEPVVPELPKEDDLPEEPDGSDSTEVPSTPVIPSEPETPTVSPDSAVRPLVPLPFLDDEYEENIPESPNFYYMLPEIYPAEIPADTPDEEIDESGRSEIVYFEQIPTASPRDLNFDKQTEKRPFFKAPVFIVVVCVGSGSLGLGLLFFVLLMLISGVKVYSYDGTQYKFLCILFVKHSARGYYIELSEKIRDYSYSNQYKFVLGRLFIKKHKDELIYIHYDNTWIQEDIERMFTMALT